MIMLILTMMTKIPNLKTFILSSVALLYTILQVSSHRYVQRNDMANCNASCSPLLCAHLNESDSSYPKCEREVHKCKCFENEWNSPILCPKLNKHKPLLFFYERNNRFLGFMCNPAVRESFLKVSRHISGFLDIVVHWSTLEIARCCASGIDSQVFLGNLKEFPEKMEKLFSVLDLTVFPRINRKTTMLNFQRNCLSNITGKFSTAFPTLKKLDLANNLFRTIPEGTFADLKHLETIDLTYNRLRYIDRVAFENLTGLNYLDMAFNEINEVAEDAFHTLSNLQTLRMKSNKLQTLPAKTFRHNKKLEKIILSKNKITELPGDLFSELFKLVSVELDENQLHTIAPDLFLGLTKLLYVVLNKNQISSISPLQFTSNFDIRRINIAENSFTQVPNFTFTWALSHSPEILLLSNKIQSLNLPLVPNINQAKMVDLSNNAITSFNDSVRTILGHAALTSSQKIDRLVCKNCNLTFIPKKLLSNVSGSADFSNNLITKIDMDLLTNVAHLTRLDLVKNNISSIILNWSYPIIQDGNQRLPNPSTEIVLKDNRLTCDCHLLKLLRLLDKSFELPQGQIRSNMRFVLIDVICQEPADLRGLSVTFLVTDKEHKAKLVCKVNLGCPQACHCHYVAVKEVTVVNCTNLQLQHFPELNDISGELVVHLEHNQIRDLPKKDSGTWEKIRELNLADNKIQNSESLIITPSLKKLDIQRNLMRNLSEVVHHLILPNPEVSIIITHNPWECNCGVHKVRPLLFSAENLEDSNHISCFLPDSEDSVLLTNVTDFQLCPELFPEDQELLRILIPTLAAFVVLISICLTILYRYKAEVQLWLFTRGYCLRFVAEEDIDEDKIYDAFVSYSSFDDEWVAKTLVPGLENGNPAYRLCLHDRDWPVGEWIPDQIFRSVEHSRRTIIVLTNNFVESDWSRLEFHAAYRQALTDHVNRVLIIVPGDIPDVDKLDHELRAYIKLNTYIKWSDAHFWRKLRCAMPKVMTCPPTKDRHEMQARLDPYKVSPYNV